MAMTSASNNGSSTPMASTPTCCNCRYRPCCGRSARKNGPAYHSLTGSDPRCRLCSNTERITPAVPSGRNDSDRSPRSVKVYISLLTTSVVSPTPRTNTAVSSNTGSSM